MTTPDKAAPPPQAAPKAEAPSNAPGWEGAEEWMPLAWELCAEEWGEEACTELVWEGGPMPEPWGDRWLKYEDEAKRLIALVRKTVPALAAPTAAPSAPSAQPVAVPLAYAALLNTPRHGAVIFNGATVCCEENDREPCPHDPTRRCKTCPGGAAPSAPRPQKGDAA